MIDFTGKNILVVGASSGIGEETAYVLAENGANVILVARRDPPNINHIILATSRILTV